MIDIEGRIDCMVDSEAMVEKAGFSQFGIFEYR
jgi:hypothetical protein